MNKIIKCKDGNKKDYVYALCDCLLADEAIEVPRPDYSGFITFKCPRCGRNIGIFAKGKFDALYNSNC